MTTDATPPDGQPARIAFWSEAFYDVIDHHARRLRKAKAGEYDDFYQEGCLAAALYVSRHGDEPIADGYLARIVMNRMRSLARKRFRKDRKPRRRLSIDGELLETLHDDPPPTDAVLDVREALADLREVHRTTLTARYLRFRSIHELAAALHTTYNAVSCRCIKAARAARERLARGYGPDAARLRTAAPTHRFSRVGQKVDWSAWGPIPNQRDD